MRRITVSGIFTLLVFCFPVMKAAKPEKGFAALKMRDYFKAKKIFESGKKDTYCAYGLSVIYYRGDNPYSNIDSAAKFANLSFSLYRAKPKARTIEGFTIDSLAIKSLLDSLSEKKLNQIRSLNSVEVYDSFLLTYYNGSKKMIKEAVSLRDELEFNHLIGINKSDSTDCFMVTHPQSNFYPEAMMLKDRQLFDEYTVSMRAESYRSFIRKFAKNAMVATAHEKLYTIYKETSDVQGLSEYVKEFPNALQAIDAWKLLFALSVKSYSDEELKKFLENYPDFPLKTSILKELQLNKVVLFEYHKDDLIGFVNENGTIVLQPQYEEATAFYEGLSVVSRNDTVFFINKDGENPFPVTYHAAYRFQHGIAPVKRNNRWHFINRQGQVISRDYEEIGELSGGIYIVKSGDKYGALNSYGQVMLELKFEKLGDFSNGIAYYTEGGKYGFVNVTGDVQRPLFDWISGFDAGGLAIVKTGQKYGLINAAGEIVLAENYDKLIRAENGIYIVVVGNNYGFYSNEGCFLSNVAYDYQGDKLPEYYTNGQYLLLIKKDQKAVVGRNGATLVSGPYVSLGFPSFGLIRAGEEVKKELRYGYLTQKQNMAIPFKFSEAGEFRDSVAIVKLKDRYQLIGTKGEERYSSEFGLERLSGNYFAVNSDVRQVIDRRGRVVVQDVTDIQSPQPGLWIITVYGGEIKLLYD